MKSYKEWSSENDYPQHFPAGKMKDYLAKDDLHPHSHEPYYGKMGEAGRTSFIKDVDTVMPMLKDIAAYLHQTSDNYQYQAHVLNAALGKAMGHYDSK